MNETLGLLDTLEAMLMDGNRVPLTDKVMVDEQSFLQLIDKIRLSVKSGGRAAQNLFDGQAPVESANGPATAPAQPVDNASTISISLLEKEEAEAEKLSRDSQLYADQVMANLQLMVTKMQTNLVKFEKSIEEGRQSIETLTKERKESNDTF